MVPADVDENAKSIWFLRVYMTIVTQATEISNIV